MNLFFVTLGYSGLFPKIPNIIASVISLILALFILIYLNETTLFLAATLLSLVAIKSINKYEETTKRYNDKSIVVDKMVGVWFALSIAPATHVSFTQLTLLENGFLIQVTLSFVLFIFFQKSKPSIIGRVSRSAKGAIAIVGDDILAGFSAGIGSSLLWHTYLYLQGV